MFTGIVEEMGTIKGVHTDSNGVKIEVSCKTILEDIHIDDSIAINGACQTVVSFTKDSFTVQAVKETLNRTTFGSFKMGRRVNLERAMKADGRFGGHMVQGHVDCIGRVVNVINTGLSVDYYLEVDTKSSKYIVDKGSITLDGISLTVSEITGNTFRVSIIPHTVKSTIISEWRIGTSVNIETDIIGRYIEKFTTQGQGLTIDKLKEYGF